VSLKNWDKRIYGSIEAQQAMQTYMTRFKETLTKAAKKAAQTLRKGKGKA